MAEPVTLAETKAHLRVIGADEDALITALIIAAREWVENFTGLILVEREVTEAFDGFAHWMALNAWPIADDATVQLSYIDTDGETVDIADHRLVAVKQPARLMPAFDSYWPSTYSTPGAVTATFTAGYASADAVPQSLKQAMLLLIGHWFNQREAVAIGVTAQEVPMAVDALCRPYRLVSV